ncbi:RHS repeat-associated core domain-containing protein [bacterium]|nr:RHS repeat-associated core domain-containing protein [bacterium]
MQQWGKVISTEGSLASTVGTNNPIRYRGYYYDSETSLYYLQSRYYDPETGRFISPDQIIDNGNLYAYCGNDPVNYTDHTGTSKFTDWLNKFALFVTTALRQQATAQISHATNIASMPEEENFDIIVGVTVTACLVALSIATLGAGTVLLGIAIRSFGRRLWSIKRSGKSR